MSTATSTTQLYHRESSRTFMLNICDFPVELVSEILGYTLGVHPVPSDLLRVNALFYAIGLVILHSHLRFGRPRQLLEFAAGTTPLACSPRALTIEVPSGPNATDTSFSVFRTLNLVLRRCGAEPPGILDPELGRGRQVSLELLELAVTTHIHDPQVQWVYGALRLANPRVFIWRGSDPEHHFSIAIVPIAASHALRAVARWTNVQEITLTNIAFPSKDIGLDGPLLSTIPKTLRRITIDRATMLQPKRVAEMVCSSEGENLELVRLVDAYSDSIWGPRIRRSDVERAAMRATGAGPLAAERVKRVIVCEAKTERIMGGDRAGGLSVLE